MIPQSFKIIWKQRRYNGLIMIEIVFSFIALFALASVVLTYTKRYQEPFGMNNKNIWIIRAWPSENAVADKRLPDSIILIKRDLIKKHLKSNYSEIKEVSMMTNQDIPYGRSMSFNCTNFKKKQICYHRSLTEPDFYKTFDIKLLEGRWVSPEDALSGILTVVINKKLKQEFFGNQQAAGKTIYIDDEKPRLMKVVGIFEAIKRQGEFNEEPNFMF